MTESITETALREPPVTALAPENLPDVDNLVTEDDAPVDNFASEKQQRLLTRSLYSTWAGPGEERPFLAAADVGLFLSLYEPPLVPDVFLSLDVTASEDWWAKGHRAYFFWEFGKAPEVVIEIVSNREGGETDIKMEGYARLGIPYYVIYDPLQQVQDEVLRVYALQLTPERVYEETDPSLLASVGLGLTLWEGEFEGRHDTWLRWQDKDGNLILTGAEQAALERQRTEQERQRAEQAEQQAKLERKRAEQAEHQAEQERQRAERLAAQLRALGVEPEDT